PEEIRTYFGISKGQFKRAVGRLMKNNLAKQDKEGTFMTEEAIEREL
ncbi:MAG TPA: DNA-binding protein, partial [Atopostipes sp.]|nr:DNA-binding protein [Atopostipes sp.]